MYILIVYIVGFVHCIELAESLLNLIGQIIYNIYCKCDPITINIIYVKHILTFQNCNILCF